MTKPDIAKHYQDGAIQIFTKSKAPLDRETADKLIDLILGAVNTATKPTRLQVALELGIRPERLTRLIKALEIGAEFERLQKLARAKEGSGKLW